MKILAQMSDLRDSITVDDVIATLNEAVQMDREGMQRLVDERVPCNEALANHRSIQVLHRNEAQPDLPADYMVGLVGLLNGLFGISETGFGPISAVYDENKLTGFDRTSDEYLHGPRTIDAQMGDLTVADFLQSRIHQAFTVVADDLCSLGYLDTATRIAVSGAIGKVLDLFRDKMAEIGTDQIDLDPDLARDLILKGGKEAEGVYMRPSPPSGAYAPLAEEAIEGTGKIGEDEEKEGAGQSWDLLRTLIEAESLRFPFLTPKQVEFNVKMKQVTGQLPGMKVSTTMREACLHTFAQSTESEPYQVPVVERTREPDRFEIYDMNDVILEDQQADPANWDSQAGWDITMSEFEQSEIPLVRPG